MSLTSREDEFNGSLNSHSPKENGNGNIVRAKIESRSPSTDALTDSDSSGEIEGGELHLDTTTLVANTRRSMDDNYRRSSHGLVQLDGVPKQSGSAANKDAANPERRTSIQVRLEKTDRKGRYILKADDPDIKDILRKGIERKEELAGTKKSRVRFRDLVFTRQFTTFDRQNPSAAESPFFGFFTLFWVGPLPSSKS